MRRGLRTPADFTWKPSFCICGTLDTEETVIFVGSEIVEGEIYGTGNESHVTQYTFYIATICVPLHERSTVRTWNKV